ncbi:phosphoribosylanthranilate isomerase [Dehalogenimonas formicexedens]|uniref:N-(5'-phosphoribosyl)anthranilate isomerase n=1 Tax=Dehalogenimonas formicexedens TaxID=1839801 RepID=A0A1P8F5T1_9CHLR|nr:phosphoribosylanthranilate isomerase [Dehalogenimonas formicexedens]APV43790.1 phosphoribosylanthranilate isomerase [Dehalogenimonas formicexedens]
MTRIKICGITDVETASLCMRLGVDFIGLVFADSRRRITPEQAVELTRTILTQAKRPKIAGVFVNETAGKVNHTAEACHLDVIQLSGDEDGDYCGRITRPIIRATRIDQTSAAEEIQCRIAATGARDIHLIDRHSPGSFGGSGQKFDWAILENLSPALKIMVAGGLTPENVEELILRYHPWGVDVSSGVESHGRKDPAKIMAFIRAVRQADAKLKGVTNAAR